MDSAVQVSWKPLAADSVEAQHIFFHPLQPGDTFASIAAKHRKSHTVAIIISNSTNSLELSPEFSEGVVKSKKNSLPMVLVSSEDGGRVRDLLGHHDPGELYARLEAKSQAHVDLKNPAVSRVAGGSQSPEMQLKQKSSEG